MIADAAEIDPDEIHRLDGRLVMKSRRDQRSRADDVTRGDHGVMAVRFFQEIDLRRQILDAAGWNSNPSIRLARIGNIDSIDRSLQISVEVVESDQLDVKDVIHLIAGHTATGE